MTVPWLQLVFDYQEAIIIIIALIIIVVIFIKNRPSEEPHPITIEADEVSFRIFNAKSNTSDCFNWDDIHEIIIQTTDDGPSYEDFYYHLKFIDCNISIPSEANGMGVFNDYLLELDNFNLQMFIEAIGSTDDKSFLCYQ